MSDTKSTSPFEGFKALKGDTIAPDDLEIKEVGNVESLGEDTGIVDQTDDVVDEL